jgi:hypothetical protein
MMTDPALVFEMDPQNVRRVEQWIAGRWPGEDLPKEADGSRLTWHLGSRGEGIESVVATESFLSLPAGEVDRHLDDAVTVCELRPGGAHCYLLLSVDGAQAVTD